MSEVRSRRAENQNGRADFSCHWARSALIALLFALYSLPVWAQCGTPGADCFTAQPDTADSLFRTTNGATTSLLATLGTDAASATVSSTSKFPSSGALQIDSEILYYASKDSTHFTGLIHAQDGTTAASHAINARVRSPILDLHHNKLASAIVETQTKPDSEASTPASHKFLVGSGPGTSASRPLASAEVTTAQGGTPALSNLRVAKSAASTLANGDKGKTIALGGSAFYTLTVGAAAGFDPDFMALLLNEDSGRAKKISISGLSSFFLYPDQTAIIFVQNNVWRVFQNTRWKPPSGTFVFVDGTNGNDANDGLAAGAGGALATPQAAINRIKADFDLSKVGTPVVVKLAGGTYSSSGAPVITVDGPFFGYQPTTNTFPSASEPAILIQGDLATPSNVVLNSNGAAGTVLAILGPTIGIEGVKILSGTAGLRVAYATVLFGNLILGECHENKISLSHFGLVENYSNFSIQGNSGTVISADFQSSAYITGTITLLSDITDSFFVLSQRASGIDFVSATINLNGHTVTGARFGTQSNGSITTGTNSLTYFPGSSPGTIGGLGTYDNLGISDLTASGTHQFRGRGTGSVLLGEWAFRNSYGALSLNGSLSGGSYNIASGPADLTLYLNRPTGGDITFRENNASSPSQMVLKQTSGNLGIGTNAPTSRLHVVGLPVFANNAAALAGGLTVGAFYRTGGDPDTVSVVH